MAVTLGRNSYALVLDRHFGRSMFEAVKFSRSPVFEAVVVPPERCTYCKEGQCVRGEFVPGTGFNFHASRTLPTLMNCQAARVGGGMCERF